MDQFSGGGSVSLGLYAKFGYAENDIAAVLLYGSEKGAERGLSYIISTVRNAAM